MTEYRGPEGFSPGFFFWEKFFLHFSCGSGNIIVR